MKKILFLYQKNTSFYVTKYAEKHNPNIQVVEADFDDLCFEIDTSTEQKVKVTVNGKDLKNFDCVMIKKYFKKSIEVIYSTALYLKNEKVKFFNDISLRMADHGKLSQMIDLAYAGYDVPRTIYIGKKVIENTIETPIKGDRFILKSTSSTFGSDNYLLKDFQEAKKIIKENSQNNYIFQNFLDNDGDFRIFCVNYEPKSICIRRRKDDSTHVNNTSKGGTYEYVEMKDYPELVEISNGVSKLFGIGISGVDVIKANNKNYVLEVNVNPGYTVDLNYDEELEYVLNEMIK